MLLSNTHLTTLFQNLAKKGSFVVNHGCVLTEEQTQTWRAACEKNTQELEAAARKKRAGGNKRNRK